MKYCGLDKESAKQQIKDATIEMNEFKVRDHDHYNGLYRGAAHYGCNLGLNYKDQIFNYIQGVQ